MYTYSAFVVALFVSAGHSAVVAERAAQGSIPASFTGYDGCTGGEACGFTLHGPGQWNAALSKAALDSAPPKGGKSYGRQKKCGSCWEITANQYVDDAGNPSSNLATFNGTKTMKVVITNECDDNTCRLNGGVNKLKKQVHFDLCKANGSDRMFFPNGAGNGPGNAIGSARELAMSECGNWQKGAPREDWALDTQ
ncbi:MAG: hypothetical protein M1833_006663 [Piccolia ochrophora]|nr:MAG: hypothetical protein M1833_006663 [Piccolia ochrophora]